jgi:hypothetical protein
VGLSRGVMMAAHELDELMAEKRLGFLPRRE